MIKTDELIRQLGASFSYKGFKFSVLAVNTAVANEDTLLHITDKIYAVVAQVYNISQHCVEKDIRTLVNEIWNNGNRTLLNEIVGYELAAKPSAGRFIDLLASYILRENKKEKETHI